MALWMLALSGCMHKGPSPSLTNDAYVWQRHWNAPLLKAMTDAAPSIRVWHVLAAEADFKADLTEIKVDREALRRMAKPVVAVIRIEGRKSATPLGVKLAVASAGLVADWKRNGVPVDGVEIDFDCATGRLAEYREYLKLLRARIPRDMALSITALPSWMGSNALPGLLTEADETVLQVHSVMSPEKGLFDQATAYRWAQEWSKVSRVPFQIALPTYWSRVTWNEAGRVAAIESETNRHGSGQDGREIVVSPAEVSLLVAQFHGRPPVGLKGIAWFRLPTGEDRRAWTLHTWQAVMEDKTLQAAAPVLRFQADATGATDVYLHNQSDVDGTLPAQVSISAHGCELSDAVPPYHSQPSIDGVAFRLQGNDMLRAGQERLIGWVRCSGSDWKSHVSY